MRGIFVVLTVILACFQRSFSFQYTVNSVASTAFKQQRSNVASFQLRAVQKDEKGYEIKPRDWFNGLSKDPGASLTDPRAVPSECREFAENIKQNRGKSSLAEAITMIDKHYNYFSVPFSCGKIENPANVNTNEAKIFSFALMTRMNEEQTIRLFGETKDSNAHVREFTQCGWPGVNFSSGLAIVSKLQAYDDTESALATQATIEGGAAWDINSDSWIP